VRQLALLQPGIERQRMAQRLTWLLAYSAVLFGGLLVAAAAIKRAQQPYIGLAGAILMLVIASWFFRPRLTLYATVFFALIGDLVTVSWFPFNKNLSSHESILYISDGVSLSPLELVLFTGIGVTFMRGFAAGRRPFALGSLGRPLIVFSFFVMFGLFRGLSRGGDFRISMFEVRPMLYIVMMYLLVNTICTEARHLRILMGAAAVAVFIQSLLSLEYLQGLHLESIDDLDTLTEHGSAIGHNLLFMFALTSLAFRRIDVRQRIILVVMSVPAFMVYLASQRRAAVIAFAAALIMLGVMLFWRQRRTFWKVVPVFAILATGYLGAFWNVETSLGFPAQAVKGVIAPEQLGEQDQASDLYRIGENIDVNYTIRTSPIFGLGFGQKFYRPYPLPDISNFEFNEYIPHQSFLWIWIRTGFFGFATLVYIIGRSVMMGGDRMYRMRDGPDAVIAATALYFVVMYTIYCYVDIGWDPRNMILLGTSLSILSRPLTSVRRGVPPLDDEEPARRALVPTA
jgi:hypothetical protein